LRHTFTIAVHNDKQWYYTRRVEKKTVFPIHEGGDLSLVKNYRLVSLTSVVYKPVEHVLAGYIRQLWDDMD